MWHSGHTSEIKVCSCSCVLNPVKKPELGGGCWENFDNSFLLWRDCIASGKFLVVKLQNILPDFQLPKVSWLPILHMHYHAESYQFSPWIPQELHHMFFFILLHFFSASGRLVRRIISSKTIQSGPPPYSYINYTILYQVLLSHIDSNFVVFRSHYILVRVIQAFTSLFTKPNKRYIWFVAGLYN